MCTSATRLEPDQDTARACLSAWVSGFSTRDQNTPTAHVEVSLSNQ